MYIAGAKNMYNIIATYILLPKQYAVIHNHKNRHV